MTNALRHGQSQVLQKLRPHRQPELPPRSGASCRLLLQSLQRLFKIVEARPAMRRRVLAAHFNADISRMIVKVGHEHLADELVEMPILLHSCLHLRGKRPDETIGEKDPEESPHKGTADHLTKNFRGLIN